MKINMKLKDDLSEKVYYDYADYPIYIKKGLLSYYPDFAAPSHWHDDIEMIAVIKGEMKYNINGKIVTLHPGDGIVINSKQMHFGYSDDKTECEFYCVLLHPLLLCATPAYEKNFVMPIIKNKGFDFILLSKNEVWQQEIYNMICSIYSVRNKKTAPLRVQSVFLNIWTLIYENMSVNEEQEKISSNLVVIKNMVRFIQQNFADKITLSDIAGAGAVGESKCCRMFKQYLNETPNAYLNQYRLDKSAELLRNTDMSITEIALFVGYAGSSYYTETFHKWFGKTPKQYREVAKQLIKSGIV